MRNKIFIISLLVIIAIVVFVTVRITSDSAKDNPAQISVTQQPAVALNDSRATASLTSQQPTTTANASQNGTNSSQPSAAASSTSQTAQASAPEYLYCPEANKLQKEGGWWKIGDIWKSDSQSPGQKIKEFIGAQWIGVKFGRIICLYSEEEKYAFPVALVTVNPVLIFDPESTSWIANKKGYKDCVSHNVLDCPFLQQKPSDTTDIYKQIEYKDKNKRME